MNFAYEFWLLPLDSLSHIAFETVQQWNYYLL